MHARTCAGRMPTLLPLLACFFHLKYSILKSAINYKVIMTMRTIFRLLSLLFIFYWPMECLGADGDENS